MKKNFSDRINELFSQEEWTRARRLLEKARDKDPNSHWLLTQLAVTYYEQRRYKEGLALLEQSAEIVPDCPLTIWNLAGALDALGRTAEAVRLYVWLLKADVSPREDPCWESKAWTESLKADCVYRLGVSLEKLGRKRSAEECFRKYVDLLLLGIDGSYDIDKALQKVRRLHGGNGQAAREIHRVIQATLAAAGTRRGKTRAKTPSRVRGS